MGDEIMTLRNDRRLGVINGSRGVVEDIDLDKRGIQVRLDDDRVVFLPPDYLEERNVTHGYAITGHKAQGMTTDRAFVLGDESLYREWGYVAMSRGREENRLYVVMGDGALDEVGGAVDRPYEVDQLVRSLEKSRAKSLAFDMNGDVADKDTKALRADQDALYEQLSGGPRDPSGKLGSVRQEAERMREWIEQERQVAAEAQKKLASMGALAKARGKPEVDELRRRVNGCERAEDRLEENLRSLRDQEKELVQSKQEWERWVRDQSPLVGRVQEIENEPERRNRALLRDRESNLPTYLEQSVGEVSERPSEKNEWRKTVLAIEDYRDKYDITDQKRALGAEPRNAEQRREKEGVEQQIEDHKDRRLGQSRDDDIGIERSLELTL